MHWLQLVTSLLLCALFAKAYSDPGSPPRVRRRELLAAGAGGRVLAQLWATGLTSFLLGGVVMALQGAFDIVALPWWLIVLFAGVGVSTFTLYALLYPFLIEWRRS